MIIIPLVPYLYAKTFVCNKVWIGLNNFMGIDEAIPERNSISHC